jgi:hypothetical protein
LIKIDTTEIEKKAADLGASLDQLPFIMSLALNKAAFAARKELVGHTWPNSIVERNKSFINAALRVRTSTKNDLSVEIFDYLDRAQLLRHAKGGTKTPRGSQLAIPSRNVRIGSRGVVNSQRPRNLDPGKSFVRNNRIYQVVGRGKARHVKLMYFLKPSVRVPKDVPFVEDFNAVIRKEILNNLPQAVIRAMTTRKT